MKKTFIILIFLILNGCNYHFFVKNDKVIKSTFGYIFFGVDELSNMTTDYFVPIEKIDTSKDYLTDFLLEAKDCGFKINIGRERRLQLQQYADELYNQLYETNHRTPIDDFRRKTIGTIYLLPVEIEFSDITPRNSYEKQKYNVKHDTVFLFKNNKINFQYSNGKIIRLFNVFPKTSRF